VGPVIDAAPMLGNLLDGDGDGPMACLSFNGNKTITTGQGGAVVGDDPEQERQVRHLASVAKSGPYEFDRPGFNYRMPNLNAAMGCAQMERLEEFRAAKVLTMQRYRQAGLDMLPSGWMAVWYAGDNRMTKIMHLNALGIDARPFWKPLHLQAPYRDCPRAPLPSTEAIWDKLICLPCSTNLTAEDQDRVIEGCLSVAREEPTPPLLDPLSTGWQAAGHSI
jgi:perosamine synthetase